MAPSHPPTSALTTLMKTHPSIQVPTHPLYYHHLAVQILHNLQYQHDWTDLRIHTHSPLPHSPAKLLPRPLVSGMPPNRVYVHPDEQIEMLKEKITEQDVEGEREWVLPTHLREKWSLRRFAEVFDAVGTEPPGEGKQEVEGRGQDEEPGEVEGIGVETETGSQKGMKRRGGKRVLLATVSDDSTIVYYIVHDGLVKPRQN